MIEVIAAGGTLLGLGLIARDTLLRLKRISFDRVQREELDAVRKQVAEIDERVSGLVLGGR